MSKNPVGRPPVREQDKKQVVNARIHPSKIKQLKQLYSEYTMSQLIEEALTHYYELD